MTNEAIATCYGERLGLPLSQMACNHVEKFEWAPLALHQYILPVLLTSEAVARQVLRALFDLLT